jgi:hypothetical protein
MSEVLTTLRPNADALAVLDDLSRPLEERLLSPMVEAGYEAPLPVLTEAPAPLEVRYTDRGTTLTAADYLRDPLVAHDGGLVRAPRSVRRRLKKLERHGIDPERLWILREMAGVWRPGETPPRMVAVEEVETTRNRHVQHLQAGAVAFAIGRGLLYTAGAAVVVATGAVVAVGGIAIAGIAGAAAGVASGPVSTPLSGGLDPIVLAGLTHRETGAVAWVPIAAWDEIKDERDW